MVTAGLVNGERKGGGENGCVRGGGKRIGVYNKRSEEKVKSIVNSSEKRREEDVKRREQVATN